MFFDKIEMALKPQPFKFILENIYGGMTCNTMVCQGCGNEWEREELFYNLSLQVKNLKNISESLS